MDDQLGKLKDLKFIDLRLSVISFKGLSFDLNGTQHIPVCKGLQLRQAGALVHELQPHYVEDSV